MRPDWAPALPAIDFWLHESGSNRRPLPYEGNALPTAPPCTNFLGWPRRLELLLPGPHPGVLPLTLRPPLFLWWVGMESNHQARGHGATIRWSRR
jgi:hypothetical protein